MEAPWNRGGGWKPIRKPRLEDAPRARFVARWATHLFASAGIAATLWAGFHFGWWGNLRHLDEVLPSHAGGGTSRLGGGTTFMVPAEGVGKTHWIDVQVSGPGRPAQVPLSVTITAPSGESRHIASRAGERLSYVTDEVGTHGVTVAADRWLGPDRADRSIEVRVSVTRSGL